MLAHKHLPITTLERKAHNSRISTPGMEKNGWRRRYLLLVTAECTNSKVTGLHQQLKENATFLLQLGESKAPSQSTTVTVVSIPTIRIPTMSSLT